MADEIIEWIDPDANTHTLTVEWGASGRMGLRSIHDIAPSPLQPGGRLKSVRHDVREFALPLFIQSTNDLTLRADTRELVYALEPTRGNGTLRVTAPGGDQREITCRVIDGLDFPEEFGNNTGIDWQSFTVIMSAVDPYWIDVSDTTASISTGDASTFFPFFPLSLSSSEVFGTTTINNTGELETWPIITITGPGDSPIVTNVTTGETFALDYVVSTGEIITIDTRPGHKTVTSDDGTNLFEYLATGSSLWPLAIGNNLIEIEMGSSTGSSEIAISYRRRWLGA